MRNQGADDEMTDLAAGHAGEDEARKGASAWARQPLDPRKTILFVAADGIVSERLVHALRREFTQIVVKFVADVRSACRPFDYPVALVLVDPSMIAAAELLSRELLRIHPHALTAAIQRDGSACECSFPEILRFPSVRGVLPMNVSLDVWLSVMRLMLCGGEYFPPGILRSCSRTLASPLLTTRMASPSKGMKNTAPPESEGRIVDLTRRELQVLEMVAGGLQNKAIAAEFGRSEHTVKVHLHNIIGKLGVHNRTEAADKLRRFREASFRLEG
jgi:DNA-binding NarL/FixJ family response regulator